MQSVKYQPILFSLLLALVLQLLPWAGFGLKLKPDFMLLVVIYWLLRAPYFCNIGTAWFVGLVMDLVTGGIFGQYGLAYAISAFFAVHYQRRLALFNVWQQSAYVFVLLLLAQTVMFNFKNVLRRSKSRLDLLFCQASQVFCYGKCLFIHALVLMRHLIKADRNGN